MAIMIKRLPFYVLLVLLSACATPTTQRPTPVDERVAAEMRKQRELAIFAQVKAQRQVMTVAYPLLAAAVPLCKGAERYSLGMLFANKYVFSEAFQNSAAELLHLEDELRVTQVFAETSAARAGLREGDILLAMNGEAVPLGKDAAKNLFRKMLEVMQAERALNLTVLRDRQQLDFSVQPSLICSYGVLVSNSDAINAYADGQRIAITRGMLRFVENDRELALVIAHELAHNAMEHIRSQQQNYWMGSVVDIIAGVYGVPTGGLFGNLASRAYSPEFEAEADYVGLYIMARAGIDLGDAAQFWRRMAVEHPSSIQSGLLASHPATPERFIAIEQTVGEIESKRASGGELLPEIRK